MKQTLLNGPGTSADATDGPLGALSRWPDPRRQLPGQDRVGNYSFPFFITSPRRPPRRRS